MDKTGKLSWAEKIILHQAEKDLIRRFPQVSKSTWAKVFGWAQFAFVTAGQIFSGGPAPHSWRDWLAVAASAAVAVATHHASGTDGSK